MNRQQLLSQLLDEATRKAEEERDFQNHVARVAKIAQPEIDKILAQHKAETSKSYECPNCGHVLEGWRPDEATTSGTSEDDPDNGDDDDTDDNDGRELDAKAKSRVVAELLANKRHR